MGQIISIGINHFTFFLHSYLSNVFIVDIIFFHVMTLSGFTGNNGKHFFNENTYQLATIKTLYKYLGLTATTSNCSFLVAIFIQTEPLVPQRQRD